MESIVVKYDCLLLEYLILNIKNKSKNNIKSLLKNGQILVNNKIITKHDYKVYKNNRISINYNIDRRDNGLDILYEDSNLIVINKPSGLLTIANNREREKTAYHMVSEYLKEKYKNSKVFIVHRLDKDTSGVVVFAKGKRIQQLLQDNWDKIVLLREYIAVVEGVLEKKEDTIKSYLTENATTKVYSVNDRTKGKLAITNYRVLKESKKYSLLNVNIETGRKNQIRVHMKELGHPIIGDKKYGSKVNPINRLGLHASVLKIINPLTKETMTFKARPPRKFDNLFKN